MKKAIIIAVISLAIGAGAGFGAAKTVLSEPPQVTKAPAEPEVEGLSDIDKASQAMIITLRDKKGKDFDKEFLTQMMSNSQNAVDMANLADSRAERDEIKKWSQYIIKVQSDDIITMKTWYGQWGYRSEDVKNNPDKH